MKENLQHTNSSFEKKNRRIRKLKSTSQFFQYVLDNNSGIHSIQQRVKQFDDLNLNSSNQERNNEEQVIGHSKDNTNINNNNGKFEISVFTNCINNNFENINNSAMKNTGSIKEIVNQNVDMESNEKMKDRKKNVITEENIICNVSESCKIASKIFQKDFEK